MTYPQTILHNPPFSIESDGRIYWAADWARLWNAIDAGKLPVHKVFHGPQAYGDSTLYYATR